jgi:hypothetical protein
MARKIRLGGCSAEKKRFRRSADGEVMVATDDIIDATAVITLACWCILNMDTALSAGPAIRESERYHCNALGSSDTIRSVFVELRGRCHDLVNCSPNSVSRNLLRPHAQKQSLHRPYYRQQLVEIVRRRN